MTVLVAGANGQLGYEMRIVSLMVVIIAEML